MPLFASISDFASWIGPDRDSQEYMTGYPASLLTTVTHHAEDSLYFVEGDPVAARNLTATFQPNSIAVLAGCTTGQPGPGSFVHQLNQAGFRTVIATSTGVDGSVAGRFVNTMMSELESAGSLTMADLFARTQRTLHSSDGLAAKHSILSFTLLGNPDVELCLPE
jgi:hypothetical protein